MKILVLNGPNINMLGIREPAIYGKQDYAALCALVQSTCAEKGIEVELYQSNHEGAIVDAIQQAYGRIDGIVINPAAYTHTSIAILDALKAVAIPAVEVHISDVSKREDFRQISYVREACIATIAGHGTDGYLEAIDYLFEGWESLYAEMEIDRRNWTMDYDGLTFYFSPYELSVYAAGVLTIDIDFAEAPEVFRKNYITAPEQGRASAVTFHSYMELDGANGKKDTLLVGPFRESVEDYYLKLEIEKNGENILDYEVYAYEYRAYLVTKAEKHYLFVEATADNDYDVLYVFDLSQDRITEPLVQMNAGFATVPVPTDTTDYSFVEEIFNNPAEIRLSSRLDVFRTMSGTRCYTFDADAKTLVPQTDFYLLNETQTPLVAKLPVEVTMLSDQSKETVPAGTEFTFLRSDGKTYVEFRLPDGRECRVTREESFGWPYTVNGVPEEDVFEGILYAG